jgi:predicted RNase H-like nuclease (RuvC/YqgF family)
MTNVSKKSKEILLVNSLEKIKMCKSELRKNIVSLLIENEKIKTQYDTDIRQHRLTIRNLEKNIERAEKELEEKNKEVTMLRDEIDSYEIYDPECVESSNEKNQKTLKKYMLLFICSIFVYNAVLTSLVGWIIY